MNWVRAHWRRISTGLLVAALAGVGGQQLYKTYFEDCCAPGSPCCHPGAACCHGHAHAQAMR